MVVLDLPHRNIQVLSLKSVTQRVSHNWSLMPVHRFGLNIFWFRLASFLFGPKRYRLVGKISLLCSPLSSLSQISDIGHPTMETFSPPLSSSCNGRSRDPSLQSLGSRLDSPSDTTLYSAIGHFRTRSTSGIWQERPRLSE